MKLQKEEAEALHKRMNTEFENLSNRIFQSKAEDFTRLNAEHLGNLLRPLGDNLKDFRQKVEQVYSTEAKERFSLGERIKELVELNNRLSEDANNLTRALKGDSKICLLYTSRRLEITGRISGRETCIPPSECADKRLPAPRLQRKSLERRQRQGMQILLHQDYPRAAGRH